MASFQHAGRPEHLRQPPVVSLRAESGFTSPDVQGPSEAEPLGRIVGPRVLDNNYSFYR